jgi:hypothetical protein
MKRLKELLAAGDPLERLAQVIVEFEVFRADLETVLSRSDRARGGRPPYDDVPMFALGASALVTLSPITPFVLVFTSVYLYPASPVSRMTRPEIRPQKIFTIVMIIRGERALEFVFH